MRWDVPAGIFQHDPPHPEMGVLEMGIAVSGGKSVATSQYHNRALRVIRPHYLDDSGQVYYIIVNPGGGYVGGDAYRIAISVQENASALVTDQSAAKVYRTPGDFVVQNIDLKVADGAVLEFIPDQMILYRNADFRQQILADVHPNGSLFFSDIVTPGWSPDGELFQYQQAHLRNVVTVDGEVELIDNIRIRPLGEDFASGQDFYLDGRTHVATAVCFDPGITDDLLEKVRELVRELSEADASIVSAVTATTRPGFVMRALGNRTEELFSIIKGVASTVRGELRGQGAINLRQY